MDTLPMSQETLNQVVKALASEDVATSHAAFLTLLQYDEAVVGQLVDTFYAGVSVQLGGKLLETIGHIGGYEAAALFQEILFDPTAKPDYLVVAVKWLRQDGLMDSMMKEMPGSFIDFEDHDDDADNRHRNQDGRDTDF